MLRKFIIVSYSILTLGYWQLSYAQNISDTEKNIVNSINDQETAALSFLKELVNINSATHNISGVQQVGNRVQAEFKKMGFVTNWVELPDSMQRAGTLVMRHEGNGKHLLLIGHLDTVFDKDNDFKYFKRENTVAKGPGVIDDKGGIMVILYALKGLHEAKVLDNTNITIVLTGDEEDSGKPTTISRKPLFDAAKNVDVALDFEPALQLNTATVARRGISNWSIEAWGKEGHSSHIFQSDMGYGAIFEISRILDTLRSELSAEKYLSFNPGLLIGGTSVEISEAEAQGFGKKNVISKIALAKGDLRFISAEQKHFAEKLINETVKKNLPETQAQITFTDAIPAMAPTAANYDLLEIYSQASVDLGYGTVTAIDPAARGAGDISHIASTVPACLAGLGPVGAGMHSENETLDIASLKINTQRAAILIYRLSH